MRGMRLLQGVALSAGAAGGISGGTYGLLNSQARHARDIIGRPTSDPFNGDGIYTQAGMGPALVTEDEPLRFAVLGDSVAAGLGVDHAEELFGVQLAKGLAEQANRSVELTTYAISGSTSRDVEAQVDRALEREIDLALVIVGGNDVTSKMRRATSAQVLGIQLHRLRRSGAAVVLGTCPDLGTIRPIPQPLRTVARRYSLRLAALQRACALAADVTPVALADLLGPEFLARPSELFSADKFHPNAQGYATATTVLLPTLCLAAGIGDSTQTCPIDRPRAAPLSAVSTARRALRRVARSAGYRDPQQA